MLCVLCRTVLLTCEAEMQSWSRFAHGSRAQETVDSGCSNQKRTTGTVVSMRAIRGKEEYLVQEGGSSED